VGTANWNELYAARVAGLLKLAEDRGVRVFWVGLPIMGREPYGSRVAAINAVASAVCAEAGNCRFWDSWLSVADAKGRFTSYAPDEKGRRLRLRGRDLIHLTEEGGRIMAQKFLAETKDWADYRAAAPPEAEQPAAAQPETEQPAAEQPEAGQTGPARFPAQPPAATQPEAEQPAAEQPGAGQTGTVRFPAEPQGLTIMGVPPLPPRRQGPEAGAPQALPPVITAPPAETGFPVPLEPEEEEDIFVDPLPVDSDSEDPAALRLAPSAGDGETEVFRPGGVSVKPESRPLADWSEGLFYSPALGREVLFRLAQPRPGPGRPGPFPVILLLHGAWDSAEAWERELGREALLALADRLGVILALPEGGPFGWYLDGLETAMETFLLNDFLPEALKKTASDPSRLAVAGLSMGGHGALTLALKRPDLFQAAGALSAVTDLAAHAGSAHAVDPELAVDRVLGPAGPNGRNWRPFGAAGLWETRAGAWAGRPLFLGVGAGDGLTLAENRAFTRQLTRLGIDHVYQEKSGGHDWAYWSAELPGLLEFLALRLKRK
jgi:S-formylglutathione hydrolase FrmB